MAKAFHLEIITPSKTFYRGQAELVIVPTPEGEEGFMADHAWVCALLDVGELWIREPGRKEFKDAKRYLEVQNAVTKNYIGDYKAGDLKNAAASAMIDSLGDRWSYYMTADEYKSYKLHSANQYEGIGVTIDKDDETGGFRIRSVQENTPASAAKLREGQIIIAVDDEDVTDLTVDGIRELVSSKIDSKINLLVLDDGDKVTYKLDCSVIYNNPVSYELTSDLVGYIRISNFDAGSGDATIAAIDNLVTQGATSLIFDVRDNPGGWIMSFRPARSSSPLTVPGRRPSRNRTMSASRW